MILEKEILELFTYRLIVLANIKLNLFHVKCAQWAFTQLKAVFNFVLLILLYAK